MGNFGGEVGFREFFRVFVVDKSIYVVLKGCLGEGVMRGFLERGLFELGFEV